MHAFAAYEEAVDAPNGDRARLRLALGNLEGAFGDLSDPERGFEAIKAIAEEDQDDLATFYVGLAQEFGFGTKRDLETAFAVYRELAERNFASAHLRLGKFYLNGKLVDEDPVEAIRQFEIAADNGVTAALVGLSQAHAAAGDPAAALATIDKAVAAGARRADFNRALGHYRGTYGAASDRGFGAAELARLAETGDTDAAFAALRFHEDAETRLPELDLERVIATVQRAAEQGDGWATASLARAYRRLSDDIPDAETRHARLIETYGDTMVPRLQVAEKIHVLYDPDRPGESREAAYELLAETRNDGYVIGLVRLRRLGPNAFVYALQNELGALGYDDCGRTSMLTRCTIRSILQFCDDRGIGGTCRLGPLRGPTARAISEELLKARTERS